MPLVKKINHVAVIVEDLQTSLSFWQDALGLGLMAVNEVPEEAAIVAFLALDGSEIELVKPTSQESGLSRYLEKRGPGIHHICLEVDDIGAMLDRLQAKGVRLINVVPNIDRDGKKFAFIHPESTQGVLVELYELPAEHD